MKKSYQKVITVICSSLIFLPLWSTVVRGGEQVKGTGKGVNLVPSTPATAPNYWCTWYAQNYWIGRGTDLKDLKTVTNAGARDELTYQTLFNKKDGWAATYLKEGRGDFIFLIDHGWQTKKADERIAGGDAFFNLIADPRDFPQYADLHPKDRLKRFNEEIKALGWNSLGLWVRGNVTLEQARTYVRWSKYAGIKYWKIDGGGGNCSEAKKGIYPELVLEHITGAGGNINSKWNQELESYPSVYDFGGNKRKAMLDAVLHTDVFRTYDASPLLMSSTTLRRTHDILKQTQQQAKYRAVLNVQDDCNVAIGLGVLVASKRHPNMNERTLEGKDLHHQLSGPRAMQKRMNEVTRFGHWARIAPAFPAGQGVYLASEHELIDRCQFTKWDTWARATYGKLVSQSAPAIMARNMPLPVVEVDGEAPFVCATTYPNGPTGIATEGRVSPGNRWFEPRAKVTVKIKDASQPIGIAGHYKELVLQFGGDLQNVDHVWAQDLLAKQAVDIKNQVEIKGAELTIPGELIAKIGTSAGDKGDISAPGLVLQLSGKNLPVAGEDYMPRPEIAKAPEVKLLKAGGLTGTAVVEKDPYGYKVGVRPEQEGAAFAVKRLSKEISSGRATITWKMKSSNSKEATRNGFLVLSSDEDALSSVFAGAWSGSNVMSVFEGVTGYKKDIQKRFQSGDEMNCSLELDMDARTVKLTMNGKTVVKSFSESVTSVNYIGFGLRNTNTLFSEPKIIRH